MTRSGGLVLLSRYSAQFWEHRLEWFEVQSAHHLISEIDYQATGNGVAPQLRIRQLLRSSLSVSELRPPSQKWMVPACSVRSLSLECYSPDPLRLLGITTSRAHMPAPAEVLAPGADISAALTLPRRVFCFPLAPNKIGGR